MTMREFKKYLEKDIQYYKHLCEATRTTRVYDEYLRTLNELENIRKVINL